MGCGDRRKCTTSSCCAARATSRIWPPTAASWTRQSDAATPATASASRGITTVREDVRAMTDEELARALLTAHETLRLAAQAKDGELALLEAD